MEKAVRDLDQRAGALKIAACLSVLGLMAYLLANRLPSTNTWTHWTLPLSGKVIALDAGHGGPDGGAVSRDGVIEKDITLAITLHLRDYLQQAGAVVFMTRETDTDLAQPGTRELSRRKTEDLINRVEQVRKRHADLVVSVHLNSAPSARWRGAQTFYHKTNDEGRQLASLIQDELRRTLGNTDRKALSLETKYLLKALEIPGAIVEVGFLSNPEESRLLATPAYQKKVAEAVYRGIMRYTAGERVAP